MRKGVEIVTDSRDSKENIGRDEFIMSNIPLVKFVAAKYKRAVENRPIANLDDLISIGTVGLIKACDKFDGGYNVEFSTYAVPCIEGEIKTFLREKLDLVKYPRRVKENYYQILKLGLEHESPETIADKLDIPKQHAQDSLEYKRCRYVTQLSHTPFDDDDGESNTILDMLCEEVDYNENLIYNSLLNELDDRDREIVRMRLLDRTQREIGEKVGLTQSGVRVVLRSLQRKAMKYIG